VDIFYQNLVTGITLGAIYALISIGMTMVYGLLKIIHVAHASIYVLGAYLGLLIFKITGNLWLSFPVAIIGCAGLGWLMYNVVYKKVQDSKPLVPLIIGLGMFTAIGDAFRLATGPYSIGFNFDASHLNLKFEHFQITWNQLLVIIVACVLLIITWWIVNKTKTGLAWRASAQDREVAMGLGVRTYKYFSLNFMYGSSLAGVAGVLVGVYYSAVNPNMGEVWAYKVFVVMVLGGLGNVLGTVIASFILGLSESFIISYVGYFLPRDSIAFMIMIIVLIIMPYGVMGGRQRA
jgi:branched-chain amino acid transport system permease protein